MSILSAQDISKSFKLRKVVKGLSLEIKSGEVVGLLGPNGAGKTTSFYMMVGQAVPQKEVHPPEVIEIAEEGAYPVVAVRREGWKYIHHEKRPDELYDLARDPGERTNLAAEGVEVAAELERIALEVVARRGVREPPVTGRIDVDLRSEPLGTDSDGLGGALVSPTISVTIGMDHNIIIEAFLIVTIGGLGNMWGALVGSLIFGVTQSFGVLLWPQFAIIFPYLAVVIILTLKPTGMLKSVW